MKRGHYIVFEGGEGCGKSYQAKSLVQYLESKGIDYVHVREPGSTKEAEKLRKRLSNINKELSAKQEIILLSRARRSLFEKIILHELNKGKLVIADRSFYSTMAYQGYGSGISQDYMQNIHDVATLGIKPNLVFIIDIDAKDGLEKEANPDRYATKGLDYHKRVNEGFRQIAEDYPHCVLIPYLEGQQELMQKQIQEIAKQRLNL